MNNIEILNNIVETIPSYKVAEMMEKEHKDVLRMIHGTSDRDGIMQVLGEFHLEPAEYFIESTYIDSQGKERLCYECTKMGCEMLANRMTGKKGIVFTAKYVKAFNDMEQQLMVPAIEDFQSKFGNRRIRKTFRESTDIESTWKQYKELSKIERDAHRINNRDRIRACDIIVDELSDYIANNTVNMKAWQVLLYKEVIEEVLNTKQLWSNKMYGGIKSNMTVKINDLEQENQALKQQIEELTPPEHEWITCDIHGFSENYMYSWSDKGQVTRSKAYNRWINVFPADSVPDREYFEQYHNIDFNKDVAIEICYICKKEFDPKNFDKATLDMIFNRILGVDDNIVTRVLTYKVGTCDSYNDGKIIFTIYNI